MRIDAHHHIWRLARGDYGWLTPSLAELCRDFEPAMLKPLLDEARVDATIMVQAAPTEAETAYLLETAEHNTWIAGVVGWADLAAEGVASHISRLARSDKLVGLRPMLQDIPDKNWILGPSLIAGLNAMVENNLVFEALVQPAHLSAITELARRFPGLQIVIDHAGKPDIGDRVPERWSIDMTTLAAFPNVCVKLSGLLTEMRQPIDPLLLPSYFAVLIGAFGADRLLWGSDWPVLTAASTYAHWVALTVELLASLEPRSREAIWGGTAARIYRLGDH